MIDSRSPRTVSVAAFETIPLATCVAVIIASPPEIPLTRLLPTSGSFGASAMPGASDAYVTNCVRFCVDASL